MSTPAAAASPESGRDVPPQPLPDPDSQGFWDATSAGHLAVCRCTDCGAWMHPPLERCRTCGGATAFEPVDGSGVVHSFIVLHRASVPGLGPGPHVIALVDLDGAPGVRITGRLACVEPSEVEIDTPVTVRIVDVPGGSFRQPEFSLVETVEH